MQMMKPADCKLQNVSNDCLIDIVAAAAHLGVSVFTLRRWVAQRTVPFVRLGRAIRFKPSALDKFVSVHTVEPNGFQ